MTYLHISSCHSLQDFVQLAQLFASIALRKATFVVVNSSLAPPVMRRTLLESLEGE